MNVKQLRTIALLSVTALMAQSTFGMMSQMGSMWNTFKKNAMETKEQYRSFFNQLRDEATAKFSDAVRVSGEMGTSVLGHCRSGLNAFKQLDRRVQGAVALGAVAGTAGLGYYVCKKILDNVSLGYQRIFNDDAIVDNPPMKSVDEIVNVLMLLFQENSLSEDKDMLTFLKHAILSEDKDMLTFLKLAISSKDDQIPVTKLDIQSRKYQVKWVTLFFNVPYDRLVDKAQERVLKNIIDNKENKKLDTVRFQTQILDKLRKQGVADYNLQQLYKLIELIALMKKSSFIFA